LSGGVNTFGYVLANPLKDVDFLGLDIFVCLNRTGLNHIGAGVNTQNTQGRRAREDTNEFFPIPAEVSPDPTDDETRQCEVIKSSSSQDQAFQDYINENVDNPGDYNLFQRSCVDFVRDPLRDILGLELSDTNLPEALFNELNNNQRQTRRGLR